MINILISYWLSITGMLEDDVWRNGGEFVFLSSDEELASRVRDGFGELVVGVH